MSRAVSTVVMLSSRADCTALCVAHFLSYPALRVSQ